MLDSISGSDVAKIRRLVEKYAGKVGDNNASAVAAASSGISSGGVGPEGKVYRPSAQETTPRPIGLDYADAVVGKKKVGVHREWEYGRKNRAAGFIDNSDQRKNQVNAF